MGLFKKFKNKNKDKEFEDIYYSTKKETKKAKKQDISLNEEIDKYGKLGTIEKLTFDVKKNIKFPSYNKFIDTLFDVISNYKDKPGFSKEDALRMVGKKLNSQSIEMLSATLNNKDQTLAMLKLSTDKLYFQFQEIIFEKSLYKTLKLLKISQKYLEVKKKYLEAKKYKGALINLYLFGFIFGLLQWLAIPYLILSQQLVEPAKFYATRYSFYQKLFVTPFVAVNVPDIYLKIQFILEIIIILGIPAILMVLIVKTLIQYFEDKNVRMLDRHWNEYNYNTILQMKVIQMKLGDDRYEKTNYLFFLKNIGQLCFERELINIDWYKDFIKLLQIFDAIQIVIPFKEVKNNMSELFYVTFSNILEAYRGYVTGAVKNFNLGYIYDKFNGITEIQEYFIKKGVAYFVGILGMIIFLIMFFFNIWGGIIQLSDLNELTNMLRGNIGL